jgi:hypothetical protein
MNMQKKGICTVMPAIHAGLGSFWGQTTENVKAQL